MTFQPMPRANGFSEQYKKAHIKVLLKSEDKNEADPESYRPISLLPVMGKILERGIAGVLRLKGIINNHPRSSSRLYRFRPGDPLRTQLWNYNWS